MILDESGKMLSRVRTQCEACPECDIMMLEIFLNRIGQAMQLFNVDARPSHERYDLYVAKITEGAHVRFTWREHSATDLELVCGAVP